MFRATFAVLLALVYTASLPAQSITGRWDATVTDNGLAVPFALELIEEGTTVKGSLVNGDEKVTSSSGRFEDGKLVLAFDFLGAKLTAVAAGGHLEGSYDRGAKGAYPFSARPAVPAAGSAIDTPSIAGLWEVQVHSPKGESAWRFIVRQSGADVQAAILRVDGDTGTLAGRYQDGAFRLSRFAGTTPALYEVKAKGDGTLEITRNGKDRWTAVRTSEARSQGLPEPTDPLHHTSVRDPSKPLQFNFPDVNGKLVANTEPRFQGKVVILAVSGSWCPNCHDEAPFLVELYRKYHASGLEIVDLSFEEADQLKDLSRLKAFIRRYGIEYTVLVPGTPDELQAKLPQASNLNSWPTTFFIGRDGLVSGVHAGFAGPASGQYHAQQKREITETVERLLADKKFTSQR